MSEEFKVIETQEQLDKIIKDRLERSEKKWQEKYAGYLSPDDAKSQTAELEKQLADYGNSLNDANEKAKADADTIASLKADIKKYETASVKSRIAHEIGIPYELANRLNGDTEEDIRKDAESMKPFLAQKMTPPLRNPDAKDAEIDGGTKASIKKLVKNLKE